MITGVGMAARARRQGAPHWACMMSSVSHSEPLPVVIVGAGISGVSAARALTAAGVPVRLLDRGKRIGGRMAVRTEQVDGRSHAVDIGAAYVTARDAGFAELMRGWQAKGLARPWTTTFHMASDGGGLRVTTGPQRWATSGGLRTLVEDLAEGLDITSGRTVEAVWLDEAGQITVDGEPASAVVLAMPDPQAADLLPEHVVEALGIGRSDYSPAICVWGAWTTRWWPDVDGLFADGSSVVAWVADDGRRRGDGAPVLVAHTTAAFAAAHLDDPGAAVQPVLAEIADVFRQESMPEPEFVRAHRWALASPRRPHARPFGLFEAPGQGGLIGVCGDAWGARPRVEQAWLSGHRLGQELASRLAAVEG